MTHHALKTAQRLSGDTVSVYLRSQTPYGLESFTLAECELSQVLAAGEARVRQVLRLDTEEALQKCLQLRDEAKVW